MDKLRKFYNNLKANGLTKTATFEEWVANRKPEDYEKISTVFSEVNEFDSEDEYLSALGLYKKPEEIEVEKPVKQPEAPSIQKPVEAPEYPFGKTQEFGKPPKNIVGGEDYYVAPPKDQPLGEAPSNITMKTETPIMPEGLGMEKMVTLGQEALQKAENIQRNETISELGLAPESFQEGTPYDIGLNIAKLSRDAVNEDGKLKLNTYIANLKPDEEDLLNAHISLMDKDYDNAILSDYVYEAKKNNDQNALQSLLKTHGEKKVNEAYNSLINEAVNVKIDKAYKTYLDTEGKIKDRADDKVLIQKSLKKLQERKNEGMTFGQGYRGREQDIALEEKLKTNPVLTPEERMVLETLSGQTPKGNYLFTNPVEYQKLEYLNDPDPKKQITPDIELDLKINNPDYKLKTWDETDTKRFLDVNPDLPPTPENKKEYWKERDRSNPYARAWLNNPMILSDQYDNLFQTQEVQAAGEAIGRKYGALLSQYGETPKEKMEAYWNLAMSRYLELMPIVEEQTKNFDKGWGNAYVRTQQGGGSPYAETAGEISGDLILSLTNQIASLFTPGEKGVFTNEQIEFIALTNKLRALTPMVVSGKLPTESKALDNSWVTDFVNRFASGTEQIGTPGSVSAKTRGLLTNDAIASLYEAGVMDNLTPEKGKELDLATSEEGGLWNRKWMVNPESIGNFTGNLAGIAAPVMLIPSPLGKMEAIEGIGISKGSKLAKVLFNESGKLNFIGKVANTAQKSAQMGLDYEARGQVMGAIGKKQYQEELNFGTGFVGGIGRFVLDDALGIAGKALKKKLNVTSEVIEKGAGRVFGNSSKEITEETLQEMYQSWERADGDFATWQKDMFGKEGVFGSWNKALGFIVGIGAAGWMDGYSTEDTKNLMLKAAKANNIPNAGEVIQDFVEGLKESEASGIAMIGQNEGILTFEDKEGNKYTTEKDANGQVVVNPVGVVTNPDIEGVRLVAEEFYNLGKPAEETPEVVTPETQETLNEDVVSEVPESKKVIGFKTSKGSKYTIHEDGTTTRNKSYHAEHGGDEGIKPRSQGTIYVKPEDANMHLAVIQSQGGKEGTKFLAKDQETGTVRVEVIQKGEEKGTPISKAVPYSTTPKIGYYPVEVWQNGAKVHFGNEITEIEEQETENKKAIPEETQETLNEEVVSEINQENEGKETTVQPEGEKKNIERKKPIPKTKTAVTEKDGRIVNSKGEVLESDDEIHDEIASKSFDAGEIEKAISERENVVQEQTDEEIIEEFLPRLDMKSKDVAENVTDPIARGNKGTRTLDGLIEAINEQHPGRFGDDLGEKIKEQLRTEKVTTVKTDPILDRLEKRYGTVAGEDKLRELRKNREKAKKQAKPVKEATFEQTEKLEKLKAKREKAIAKKQTTFKIDARIAELEEGMAQEELAAQVTAMESAEAEEAWNKEAAEMARIEAAIEKEQAEMEANPARSPERLEKLRRRRQKAIEEAKEKATKPQKTETKKEESVSKPISKKDARYRVNVGENIDSESVDEDGYVYFETEEAANNFANEVLKKTGDFLNVEEIKKQRPKPQKPTSEKKQETKKEVSELPPLSKEKKYTKKTEKKAPFRGDGEVIIDVERVKAEKPNAYKLIKKYKGHEKFSGKDIRNLLAISYSKLMTFQSGAKDLFIQISELEDILEEFESNNNRVTKEEFKQQLKDSKDFTDKQLEVFYDLVDSLNTEFMPEYNSNEASLRFAGIDLKKSPSFYAFVSNILSSKDARAFIHEIGHFAFYNILSKEDRLLYLDYMIKNTYGVEGKSLRERLALTVEKIEGVIDGKEVIHDTNVADNFSEYFAEQFRQWYLGTKVSEKGIAAIFEKVSIFFDSFIEKIKSGRYIDKGLINYFDKIVTQQLENKFRVNSNENLISPEDKPTTFEENSKDMVQIIENSEDADLVLVISQADKYFTLWVRVKSPQGLLRWTYLMLLSTDKDEAEAKAKAYLQRIASGEKLSISFDAKNAKGTDDAKTVSLLNDIRKPEELRAINKPTTIVESKPNELTIDSRIGFGKYGDLTIDELLNKDIRYAEWLAENGSGDRGRELARVIKELMKSDDRFRLLNDIKELEQRRIEAYEERENRRRKGENVPVTTLVRGEGGEIKEVEEETKRKTPPSKQERRVVKDQVKDIIAPLKNLINKIREALMSKMFVSQVDGANAAIAALEKDGVFLNGDGAGVGKTRQIIAIADYYAKLGFPVVIISENAALGKPFEGKEPKLGGSMEKDSKEMGVELELLQGKVENGKIYVSTYNRVEEEEVPEGAVVIFDESQNLANTFGGNPDGNAEQKRWEKKFGLILKKVKKVAFYSATPADKPHQLAYLYNVLGFDSPDSFLSEMLKNGGVIKTREFGRIKIRYYDVPNNTAQREKLYKWVNGLMVKAGIEGRFIKREISYEGTDVQFHDVAGTDSDKNKWAELFNDAISQMSAAENAGFTLLAPNSYILYAAELAKIGETLRILQRELAAGRKVILFLSRIRPMEIRGRKRNADGSFGEPVDFGEIESPAKIITDELKKLGISFVELHGQSKSTSQKAQKEFSGSTNVLVASLESGGTGINLDDTTGESPRTEIFLFAPYRGISTIQGMGRIWRASTIQNDNNPNRYIFITASDIAPDAARSGVLAKKLQLMDAAIGGTAVRKLPMSKVSYDKNQLAGLELPESGDSQEKERTGILKPVSIEWKITQKGGYWAKATADLLEWIERGGVDRTGLNIRVFKGDSGEWVALAEERYEADEFAPEGINDEGEPTPPTTPKKSELSEEDNTSEEDTPKAQDSQIAPKNKRATIPFIEATKRILNKLFGGVIDISYDVMAHYEAYKADGASEATLENILISSAFVSNYEMKDGKLVKRKPDSKAVIVFNPEKIRENTAGHELFHVWFEGIKASAKGKEMIDRAIKLITTKKDGKYINPKMQQIENTAGYAGHDEDYKAEEALAELIGDAMKALFLGNFTAWEAFQHSLDKSILQRDIIGAVKDMLKYLKTRLAPFLKFMADKKGDDFNSFDFTLGDFAEFSAKDIMKGNNVKANKGDIQFQLPETRLEYNMDGSLKTPFGKPSELAENQWRVVRTPAFKNWFGDWEKAAREYRDRKYPTFEKALKANGVSQVINQNTGEPLVVYHGSPSKFTVFNFDKIGSQGTTEGHGFYFTPNKLVAEGYSERRGEGSLFSVFLNIKSPYSNETRTVTKKQISSILLELHNKDKEYALSNYGDISYEGLNRVLSEATEIENEAESDASIIGSLVNGGVADLETVLSIFSKITGKDGILTEWKKDDERIHIIVATNPTQIKLADGSNTTFSPTNPDIRFQIIGESSNMDTQTRKNLNIAKQMDSDGLDPEKIWLATGWEMGVDGKWRYEIPDGTYKRGLIQILKEKVKGLTLSDILTSKPLYDAYPQLRDIKVKIKPMERGENAHYNSQTNEIVFNETIIADKGVDPNEAIHLTLIHEVQHAIQSIEGFAVGGNPEQFEDYSEVASWWNDEGGANEDTPFNKLSKKEKKEALARYKEEVGDYNTFNKYRDLAGEVESRNVQTRAKMPMSERRVKPISKTEDVSRDNQIVMFDSPKFQLPEDTPTVSEFEKQIEAKYGIKIDLIDSRTGDLKLSKIVVPKESRGSGIGSQAMKEIIDYADKVSRRIVLTPSTDFGATSVNRLKVFYKQFGFVENTGKNKDYSTMGTMYREPIKNDSPKFQLPERSRTALKEMEFEDGYDWIEDYETTDDNGREEIRQNLIEYLTDLGDPEAESHVDDYLAEKFPTPLPVPLPENKEGGTGKQAVRQFSDNLRKYADNLSGKFRTFVLGYKPVYNRIADDVQLAKAITILEQAISDKVRSKAEAHVKYMPISEEEKETKMTEFLEQMDTNPQFREDVISEAFDDFVRDNLKEEGADLPDEPARIVAAMIILRNVTQREEALRKSGKIKEADALLDKARLLADKIAYVGTMAGRMVRVFAMWATLSTGGAMALIKANLKKIHDSHFDAKGNPTDLYGQSVKFAESLEKGLKEALKDQWIELSKRIGDLKTDMAALTEENDKMKKVIDNIQRYWDASKKTLEQERKDRAKLVQAEVKKALQNTGGGTGKSVTQKTTQNTTKTNIVSTLKGIFKAGLKFKIDQTILDVIKTELGRKAIEGAVAEQLNKGRTFAQARANIIAEFVSEGVMKIDDIDSLDFQEIMDVFEIVKRSMKINGTKALAKSMLGDAVSDPETGGDILIRGLQARMSDELAGTLPQNVTEAQAEEIVLNAINDEAFLNTLLEELKTLKDPVTGLRELNQLRTDNGFSAIGGQKKTDFLISVRGKSKAQIAAEIRTRIAEAMKTDRPLNEQLMEDMGIDKATADILTALVNQELRAQAMAEAYKKLDEILDSVETQEKKGKKSLLDTAMKAFHVKTRDGLREKLFQLISVSSGDKDLTVEVINRLKGALGIDLLTESDMNALEKLKEAADKAPLGRMKEWANKQFLNETVKRMSGGTSKYNLRLFLYRGGYWALFYPAMLSGISTHLINTESNLFILLSDFINGMIRSLWDKSERSGLWAMLNPRTTAKAIQSAWDAFWMGEGRADTATNSMQKDLVNAMRPTNDPMEVGLGNFLLMAVYGFVPGIGVVRALRKGDYQLVSMFTRLLGALDKFITVYHTERNRAVLASKVGDNYINASKKVMDNTLLDGQTIASIIASERPLYSQYGGTPAIWERIRRDELYTEALNRRAGYADVADDYARVRSLRSPVVGTFGIMARAINAQLADKPYLRFLLPFVNTTFNAMNLYLSKTPLLFAHMAGMSVSRTAGAIISKKYDLNSLTKRQEAIKESIEEEAAKLGKTVPDVREEVILREMGVGRENDPSLTFRFRYKAEQARIIWQDLEAKGAEPEEINKYKQIEKAYIAASELERGRERVSAMFVGLSIVTFALYVMAAAAILGDEPDKEILPGLTAKEVIGLIKISGTKVGDRFSGKMREQATDPVMNIWLNGKPYSYRQTLWNLELAQLGSIQDQLDTEMKKPKKDRKGMFGLTGTALFESTAGLLYSASGLQGGIGVLQFIADIGEGKTERLRDRMIKFGTPMLLIPNISKQTAKLATGGSVYYAGDDVGDIAANVFYKATNVAIIDPMQPRISEIDGKRVISLPGEMGGEIIFQSVVKPKVEWRMSNPTHLWLSANNLYSAIPERRYSGANVDIIVENEDGEEYFDKEQMTPAQFNKYIETTATAAFKDLTGMVQTNKFVLNKAITRKQWGSIPELKGKTKKLEGNKYSITATPAEFEQLALKGLWDTPSAEWSKKLKGERNVQWWAMEKVVRTLYKDKNSEYLKSIKPKKTEEKK